MFMAIRMRKEYPRTFLGIRSAVSQENVKDHLFHVILQKNGEHLAGWMLHYGMDSVSMDEVHIALYRDAGFGPGELPS